MHALHSLRPALCSLLAALALLVILHAHQPPAVVVHRVQREPYLSASGLDTPLVPVQKPFPSPPPPPQAAAQISPKSRLILHESATLPGSFSIEIDGVTWFEQGLPTSVRHTRATFSSNSTKDGRRLELRGCGRHEGSDVLGHYSRRWWRWSADDLVFETAARLYQSAVVFEQRWPTGALDTNGAALTSTFPSLALPLSDDAPPRRGFLQYDGDMGGQLYRLGPWRRSTRGVGGGLVGTAPLVVFRDDLELSTVLSPLSSFMSAAQHYDGRTLSYGLLGSMRSVPLNHSLEVILSVGSGINEAMMVWGDLLLARYAKPRDGAWRRDRTLTTLGYCTQNGAYCTGVRTQTQVGMCALIDP